MNPMAYGGQSWQLFRPEAWLIQISNFRAVWKRWKKTGEVSQHKCMERSNSLYMGVSKNRDTPKWMVYMENPIKMDDLGVPLFSETPIYRVLLQFCGVSPNKKKTSRFCKPKRRCFSSQVLPVDFHSVERNGKLGFQGTTSDFKINDTGICIYHVYNICRSKMHIM